MNKFFIAIIIILLFVTLSCETKEITVEKIVEVEVIREVPVEVFVEVPVEIEKIVEVFVEVPVEIEVVKEVVKVKEVFVTATPTPTPIPLVDKIDNEAFYECVANNISQEVAADIIVVSDGFSFTVETVNQRIVSVEQMDLIWSCGDQHGILDSDSIETEILEPENILVPTTPITTSTPIATSIPSVDKIDNEAFYECVANNTSQEVATGVSIDSDGFLNATETTEHEWDLILSCAITYGLIDLGDGIEVDTTSESTVSTSDEAAFRECIPDSVSPDIVDIAIQYNVHPDFILDSFGLTGDQIASLFSCGSITGLTDLPDKGPLTNNEKEFQSCVRLQGNISTGDFGSLIRLTQSGLPDFSQSGYRGVPPEYFQNVINCVPSIGDLLDAGSVPTEIIDKATIVGKQARPSVVVIETLDGTGSGFFVTETGTIMTNQHVVDGHDTVTVWLLDGRNFEGRVLGGTDFPDVAVVQIDASEEFIPLPIGSSDELKMGQWLVNVGHPSNVGNWVTTVGDHIKTFQSYPSMDEEDSYRTLTTSVPGVPGVSGSPLLNLDGSVVGLVYAGTPREAEHVDGNPSFVLSDQVFDYVVTRSLGLSVGIESAMNVVSDITGNESFARTSKDLPNDTPEYGMTTEIKSCVSSVIGQVGSDNFDVTIGGLPDFSKMSEIVISPSEFRLIIACLPSVHLLREPIKLVASDRQPLFDDDIIEKAYLLGQQVRDSVVAVETPSGVGTGWIMSDSGHIMTNEHVVGEFDYLTVRFLDGRRFEGPVIGRNPDLDVAVIKIDPPSGITSLSVGTTTDLKSGDPLVAIGHPGIMGYWITTIGTFTTAKTILGDGEFGLDTLVSSVPGSEGNSGGPMFNMDGQVVGLIYGGKPIGEVILGDPPKISSPEARVYLVQESLELAVDIEKAMKVATEWIKIND